MEALRIETTIGEDGIIQVPDLKAGDRVEVIILRLSPPQHRVREGGWAAGKVKILPGFDDPIPGMEDYV